jgi:hypothetical protein
MRFRNIIEQIDTMNELDKVSYFVDGLKLATQREVAYQAPETFEEAWKLAIRFDTAMFGLGKPKMDQQGYRTSQGGRNQSSSHRKYSNHSTPMELDYAGSSQGNHKENYKGQPPRGNCHNCEKSGHWKRECPQGNTSNNNNNYKGNNNNNYKGNNYKGKGKFNFLKETTPSSSQIITITWNLPMLKEIRKGCSV